MGFGLLLCGYFVLTFMSFATGEYAFAAYIIGGAVCFFAAGKLYEYKHRFAVTVCTSVVYILMGVYYGIVCMDHLLLWDLPITATSVVAVADDILFVLELAHILGILWGIFELASQVGVGRIVSGVERNLAFVVFIAVGQLALRLIPAVAEFEHQMIPRIFTLIQLVVYILNVWLLFRCYQFICPEGEENGRETKPSRFKFINRINEKLDEKAERAMKENIAYQQQKAKERERKKSKRNKNR